LKENIRDLFEETSICETINKPKRGKKIMNAKIECNNKTQIKQRESMSTITNKDDARFIEQLQDPC